MAATVPSILFRLYFDPDLSLSGITDVGNVLLYLYEINHNPAYCQGDKILRNDREKNGVIKHPNGFEIGLPWAGRTNEFVVRATIGHGGYINHERGGDTFIGDAKFRMTQLLCSPVKEFFEDTSIVELKCELRKGSQDNVVTTGIITIIAHIQFLYRAEYKLQCLAILPKAGSYSFSLKNEDENRIIYQSDSSKSTGSALTFWKEREVQWNTCQIPAKYIQNHDKSWKSLRIQIHQNKDSLFLYNTINLIDFNQINVSSKQNNYISSIKLLLQDPVNNYAPLDGGSFFQITQSVVERPHTFEQFVAHGGLRLQPTFVIDFSTFNSSSITTTSKHYHYCDVDLGNDRPAVYENWREITSHNPNLYQILLESISFQLQDYSQDRYSLFGVGAKDSLQNPFHSFPLGNTDHDHGKLTGQKALLEAYTKEIENFFLEKKFPSLLLLRPFLLNYIEMTQKELANTTNPREKPYFLLFLFLRHDLMDNIGDCLEELSKLPVSIIFLVFDEKPEDLMNLNEIVSYHSRIVNNEKEEENGISMDGHKVYDRYGKMILLPRKFLQFFCLNQHQNIQDFVWEAIKQIPEQLEKYMESNGIIPRIESFTERNQLLSASSSSLAPAIPLDG